MAEPASQQYGTDNSFTRPAAWRAVILLTAVAVINTSDRMLPGVMAEQIKHELRLSDTTIGLINGFGFLVIYALLGVPIARISDRGLYGKVIATCLATWSAMTMLGATVSSGLQLALTRMGVAMGEAGAMPAGHAFIARNFPAGSRGAPLALLTLAVPLSSVVSVYAGGMIGQYLGWRAAFAILGGLGLLLVVPVLLVLGPSQPLPTRAGGARPAPSLRASLVLLRNPCFVLIICASAFIGCGGYIVGSFVPAFLARVHHMTLAQVGASYGLGNALGSGCAVLITGNLVDRLARRDTRWTLWVVIVLIACLVPFAYAAFLVKSAALSVAFIVMTNAMGTAYLAPVIAAIQRLAPPELRATASALLLMFTALAGGLGPLATGMISDALAPTMGAQGLAMGMMVMPVCYTFAGLLFIAASLRFTRDIVD